MEQQLDIKPAFVHKKSISLNKTMYKKTSIQKRSDNNKYSPISIY